MSVAHSCLRAWIHIHGLSDWCDAFLLVRGKPLQEEFFYGGVRLQTRSHLRCLRWLWERLLDMLEHLIARKTCASHSARTFIASLERISGELWNPAQPGRAVPKNVVD